MNKEIETSSIANLLYYDPSVKKHAELRKSLEEYKFLLEISKIALNEFLQGNYEKFDSLVGENACQIRAVKIALLATQGLPEIEEYIQSINEKLKIVETLQIPTTIHIHTHKGHSLQDLIDNCNLDISISPDAYFLIGSYLLSEMKECFLNNEFMTSLLRKERCSPKVLQIKFPQVSYSFLEKIAKILRNKLSVWSVHFVRQSALMIEEKSLLKMTSSEFIHTHNNLSSLPTFWTFKSVFLLAKSQKLPLLLHIKFTKKTDEKLNVVTEDFILFKFCQTRNSYTECICSPEDLLQPTCIIQGLATFSTSIEKMKAEWINKFRQHSILEMLLAMGADHRQYPNEKHQIQIHDDEFIYYCKFAKKHGFSLCNPTTFFVQHIFCAQPSQITQSSLTIIA